ncbi:MAG: carboxypeptidase-like regulatory domain-containing protein, partial [Bacteroidales bacterium]|nr:carboxypeptidase-like regulatory domain-containing protein [Bacteroidales bacterium]
MNRKLIMFLLLLFIGIGNALAQRTITGKVTGDDGQPVLGATIAIKGTTVGTISGLDGSYSLTVPANVKGDTIVF